jgi:hypothetical protein
MSHSVIVIARILSSENEWRPVGSRTIDLLNHCAIELLNERYANAQIDCEELHSWKMTTPIFPVDLPTRDDTRPCPRWQRDRSLDIV